MILMIVSLSVALTSGQQQQMSEREIEALASRLSSTTSAPSLVPVTPNQWELPNTNGYRPGQTTVSPMPQPQVRVDDAKLRLRDPFHFSQEAQTSARGKIADELRDPPSAYFRQVVVRTDGTSEAICGQVSGRNGFGGMSQPMPFFVDYSANVLAHDPMLNGTISGMCSLYPTVVRELDWNS